MADLPMTSKTAINVPSGSFGQPDSIGRLAGLLGASCLTAMAATAITPSLPAMSVAFGEIANAEFLSQLALTLPALVIALAATPVGALVDSLGARKVLIGSALLFALAGSVGLYAWSLPVLLISRAILGLAIAGLSTGTLTLIGSLYAGDRRHRMVGLQGAASSFGGMIFLLLGGLLAAISWRLPFATYLLALLLLPLFFISLPKVGLERDPGTGGTDTDYVAWPQVVLAYVSSFVGMILFYVIPVELPFHLAAQGVADPTLTGYALSLCTFAGGTAAAFYSRIRRGMRPISILALAFALIALGQFLAAGGKYPMVLAGMAIAGCSTGLLLPTVNGLVLASTPARKHGRFSGGVATALFLGQFVAPLSARLADLLAGTTLLGTAVAAAFVTLSLLLGRLLSRQG
jgi:MFS family permease